MCADVSTQVGWLREVAERRIATFSQSGRPVSAQVRVDAGLMRGVAQSYEVHTLVVGSAPDCDVVLMDDGVAPHHLTLRLVRSPFGILAEAVALAPATVGALEIGPDAAPATQRLPVKVRIGSAELTVSGPAESAAAQAINPKPGSQRMYAGVAIVCLVSALALAAPLLHYSNAPPPSTRLVLAAQSAPPAQAVAADFSLRIAEELTRLGLGGDVTLQTENRYATLVQGQVPASKWARWQSFTEWYDQQPGAPVLVQDVTRATGLPSLKPVLMVRLSEPARIHFSDGQTRGVGDMLDEGWIVDSISAGGLTLRRGEDRSEISF